MQEPDVGLDPAAPEAKVDAQPLSHPGVPKAVFFNANGHQYAAITQISVVKEH